jgi:hypothetical protein
MYATLLLLHSFFRWLVLAALVGSIFVAYRGATGKRPFTASANAWRHWTATIAHIQMVLGMTLYLLSPIVSQPTGGASGLIFDQVFFFRYLHAALMVLAIIVLTIGSAKAKRVETDQHKYQTMLRWFIAALVIIFLVIPWPFSPLASRPFLRTF